MGYLKASGLLKRFLELYAPELQHNWVGSHFLTSSYYGGGIRRIDDKIFGYAFLQALDEMLPAHGKLVRLRVFGCSAAVKASLKSEHIEYVIINGGSRLHAMEMHFDHPEYGSIGFMVDLGGVSGVRLGALSLESSQRTFRSITQTSLSVRRPKLNATCEEPIISLASDMVYEKIEDLKTCRLVYGIGRDVIIAVDKLYGNSAGLRAFRSAVCEKTIEYLKAHQLPSRSSSHASGLDSWVWYQKIDYTQDNLNALVQAASERFRSFFTPGYEATATSDKTEAANPAVSSGSVFAYLCPCLFGQSARPSGEAEALLISLVNRGKSRPLLPR